MNADATFFAFWKSNKRKQWVRTKKSANKKFKNFYKFVIKDVENNEREEAIEEFGLTLGDNDLDDYIDFDLGFGPQLDEVNKTYKLWTNSLGSIEAVEIPKKFEDIFDNETMIQAFIVHMEFVSNKSPSPVFEIVNVRSMFSGSVANPKSVTVTHFFFEILEVLLERQDQ